MNRPWMQRSLFVDTVYFSEVIAINALRNGHGKKFRPAKQAPEEEFPLVDPAFAQYADVDHRTKKSPYPVQGQTGTGLHDRIKIYQERFQEPNLWGWVKMKRAGPSPGVVKVLTEG